MQGQFEDAEEPTATLPGTKASQAVVPQHATAYVDNHAEAELKRLELDDDGYNTSDGSELLEEWYPESEQEWDDAQAYRVDDEDWEIAEKDFTKQYNRLRQHAAVKSGDAPASLTANSKSGGAVMTLPPVNKPRASKQRAAPVVGGQKDGTPNPGIETDQLALMQKYNSRLSAMTKTYSAMGVGVNRKGPSASANKKDKADRATIEQVLDPRTRLILLKMVGRGVIFEVNGCISTGKEANVYHAFSPTQSQLALKIFKTSILVFKDRDRYVTGEHRFRRGYARHNPRKMVRMWAEKEMRNLKRLSTAGIRCPEASEVRENVLVMEFLGNEQGWASPRLKDAIASIPPSHLRGLYVELLITLRALYWRCRLVHADLSEYNILYHRSHLYIIDVSQSVEHDHPHAFDFLRSDIKNIEEWWTRRGVKTLGLRKTFDWVVADLDTLKSTPHSGFTAIQPTTGVDAPEREVNKEDKIDTSAPDFESIPSEDVKYELSDDQELLHIILDWLAHASPEEESEPAKPEEPTISPSGDVSVAAEPGPGPIDHKHDEAVFLSSYIPRNLNEVIDPEGDIQKIARGQGDGLIYGGAVTGVVGLSQDHGAATRREDASEDDSDVSSGDDAQNGEEEVVDGIEKSKASRGLRNEDAAAKKERKKAVKEAAREKRQTKMPKAEKLQLIKKSKRW
ncbi:protein kinase rio1 [Tulasnella sp. JGI-2019a]|nr:protein kinase rio1 [Tulasnella sp. JGI-2019a]KAG9036727.1 protein kinase rio1 [Tulasnella sp. JGI-2019a]